MIARFFAIAATLLLLAACSGSDETLADSAGSAGGAAGAGIGTTDTTDRPGQPDRARRGRAVPPPGPGSAEPISRSMSATGCSSATTARLSTTAARQTVERQAAWLQQFPAVTVTIEGHADQRGTTEYNLALGERRANAVKSYLGSLGIDPARVLIISYGKERLANPADADEAYRREPPRGDRGQHHRDQLSVLGRAGSGVLTMWRILARWPGGLPGRPSPRRCAATWPRSARNSGQIRLAQAQDPSLRDGGPRDPAVAAGGAAAPAHRADRGGRVRAAPDRRPHRRARGRSRRAAAGPAGGGRAPDSAAPPQERRHRAPPHRGRRRPSLIAPDTAARQGYVLGTIPQGRSAANPPTAEPSRRGWRRTGAEAATGRRSISCRPATGRRPSRRSTPSCRPIPDDPRASTASYWAGETYLFRKDYPTAASVFARNYRTYGQDAPRAPDNLLKLGIALAAMGDRDKACQTFAELAKRHPKALGADPPGARPVRTSPPAAAEAVAPVTRRVPGAARALRSIRTRAAHRRRRVGRVRQHGAGTARAGWARNAVAAPRWRWSSTMGCVRSRRARRPASPIGCRAHGIDAGAPLARPEARDGHPGSGA